MLRGGPAEQAGVMVGDELVALDQQRLRNGEDWSRSLEVELYESSTFATAVMLACMAVVFESMPIP